MVIEDGTGVNGANSYVDLIEARLIAGTFNYDLPVDDAEAEKTLVSGFLYLNSYEALLQGFRTHSEQNAAFPRTPLYNALASGFPLVPDNVIPDEVKRAQVYAASVSSSVDLFSYNSGADLQSFEVVGVYKEQYKDGSHESYKLRLIEADNLLEAYTKAAYSRNVNGGGGAYSVYRKDFGYVGR